MYDEYGCEIQEVESEFNILSFFSLLVVIISCVMLRARVQAVQADVRHEGREGRREATALRVVRQVLQRTGSVRDAPAQQGSPGGGRARERVRTAIGISETDSHVSMLHN